jgi:hypothetical protein
MIFRAASAGSRLFQLELSLRPALAADEQPGLRLNFGIQHGSASGSATRRPFLTRGSASDPGPAGGPGPLPQVTEFKSVPRRDGGRPGSRHHGCPGRVTTLQ